MTYVDDVRLHIGRLGADSSADVGKAANQGALRSYIKSHTVCGAFWVSPFLSVIGERTYRAWWSREVECRSQAQSLRSSSSLLCLLLER